MTRPRAIIDFCHPEYFPLAGATNRTTFKGAPLRDVIDFVDEMKRL